MSTISFSTAISRILSQQMRGLAIHCDHFGMIQDSLFHHLEPMIFCWDQISKVAKQFLCPGVAHRSGRWYRADHLDILKKKLQSQIQSQQHGSFMDVTAMIVRNKLELFFLCIINTPRHSNRTNHKKPPNKVQSLPFLSEVNLDFDLSDILFRWQNVFG